MKAEIIGIGTEILLGQIVNTNAAYLSRELAQLGIDVYFHTTAGDNPDRLYDTIRTALRRSDIVITTGGLGPTADDITLETIARVINKPLILKKEILKFIKSHFNKRRIKMAENNIRQAYIPKGADWIINRVGTAPGIIVGLGEKRLIALPGPPYELMPMFKNDVKNIIKKISPKKYVILTRTIKTTGLAESQIHLRVKDLLESYGDTTMGIYASPSLVELKITTKAEGIIKANKNIAGVEKIIRRRLGNLIFGTDDDTLEAVVSGLLKNKTIAIAESCTGGLLSSRLTDVPGISKNLLFSIVAYSNKAKIELLNISDKLLIKYGAVSDCVAKAMAYNVKNMADSDIGIGITGIAGPGGATKKKPVGLVYIAISAKNCLKCKRYYFLGERKMIKFRATQAALDMLRHYLTANTKK